MNICNFEAICIFKNAGQMPIENVRDIILKSCLKEVGFLNFFNKKKGPTNCIESSMDFIDKTNERWLLISIPICLICLQQTKKRF